MILKAKGATQGRKNEGINNHGANDIHIDYIKMRSPLLSNKVRI